WLNKEAELRTNTTNPNPNPNPTPGNESPADATTRLIKQWSGCMSHTTFDTANMPNAWGNMTADNNQRCMGCHINGAEGFMATTQEPGFFNTLSEKQYNMLA